MDNNPKKSSPLSSTMNSRNEVKTVYINDIESLNDSTENNDTNACYFPLKSEKYNNNIKTKGKISNTSINGNQLINKKENNDLKNNSLNKLKKLRNEKGKIEKNKNILNINPTNKEELLNEYEKKEIQNNKKNKIFISKLSNDYNKNILNKLIIDKNSGFIRNENNNDLNININSILNKEKEMLKEIEFLKKEIKLKDEIIKKLIEENKKLMEKIKLKEIDLLNSKNNEENLTKAIQENNKCISILNELILK